ncbi:MAG: type II toxin-antitoxin system ParD family antitoxin [Microvirga sp.]
MPRVSSRRWSPPGQYGSAEEVVEHALAALALNEPFGEEVTAWLREAWEKGVASGNAGPLDIDSFKAEARRRRAAGGIRFGGLLQCSGGAGFVRDLALHRAGPSSERRQNCVDIVERSNSLAQFPHQGRLRPELAKASAPS